MTTAAPDYDQIMDNLRFHFERYNDVHVDYVSIVEVSEEDCVFEIGYQHNGHDWKTRLRLVDFAPGTPEHWRVGKDRLLGMEQAVAKAMRLSTKVS